MSKPGAIQSEASFEDLWRTFLVQVELGRNLGRIAVYYGNVRPQGYVRDELLASLLMMRLVALVETALTDAIASRGLKETTRERRKGLAGSIACLARLDCVVSAPRLHAMCQVGESISKNPDRLIDWPILEHHIASSQAELLHLGLIDDRPSLAFYGNRTPVANDEPGIYMRYAFVFGVEDSKSGISLVEFAGHHSSPRA
jgi:hypothetical protein